MKTASFGLIGVGVMGGALALNIADKGHDISLYNLDESTVDDLIANAADLAPRLTKTTSVAELVANLAAPRAIILLVPAGKPVDLSIEELVKYLEPGDTIIDGGNSDYKDTQKRTIAVEKLGFNYLGVGVSGGEEGARNGPSMMVGGSPSAWEPIQPVFESIAAKFKGQPCVAHLGEGGAGHFIKTVHNGIEYADMQAIAEVYGLLRDGEKQSAAHISEVFEQWNKGVLNSYLTEISAKILAAVDSETGNAMIDMIVDKAGQKGTGRWTVVEAVRMGQNASVIEAALGARVSSAEKDFREAVEPVLGRTQSMEIDFDRADLESALLVARIIGYAQGFRILRAASDEFDWKLDYAAIAEVWREGCIIRSALLDDIAAAYRTELPRGRLILDPTFAALLAKHEGGLRRTVAKAISAGLPVPVLSGAISWFDQSRKARGTANMIQGQRDFFGAHGFRRVDKEGDFHGNW